MASSGNVNLDVTARNRAGPAIQQVKQQLSGLDSAASAVGKGLGALAGGFALGAVVSGVQQLGGAILDLAQGAAQLETLRNSFDNLSASAGAAGQEMLEALREASAGMVSDRDLLLAANKSMLLGVADSTEEMVKLMEIARVRGAAMGLSLTQAFDNIVTGLGRGSALILDNLGIIVDAEANNEAYAASIGKVASALTEQEKKQALVNAVMAEADKLTGDATAGLSESAQAIGSMGAAWQNLKDQLGTLVSPAVAAAMQGLATALNAVNTEIAKSPGERRAEDNASYLASLRAELALENELAARRASRTEPQQAPRDVGLEIINEQIAASQQQYQAIEEVARLESSSIAQASAARQAYNDTLRETGDVHAARAAQLRVEIAALEMVTDATDDYRDAQDARIRAVENAAATEKAHALAQMEADHAISETTQALLDQISKLNTVGNALDGYTGKLRGMMAQLAGVVGVGSALESFAKQEDQIKKNIAAYEAMGWSAQQIGLIVETTGNQVAAEWQEIIDAPGKAAAEAEKAARDQARAWEKETRDAAAAVERNYQKIEDAVSGVLNAALDPGVGVNVDDLLPREDAVNENARRLADIAVNGFKGQDWLEEFKNEVPDIYKILSESGDPKAEAARLLRDFQDGLVPSLLDKDKAKDLVRRMLTGEQTMAQLAQEIAGELAQEMGISLQSAQEAANKALGVNTPGSPAAQAAVEITPTVNTANLAPAIAGAVADAGAQPVTLAPTVDTAALDAALKTAVDTLTGTTVTVTPTINTEGAVWLMVSNIKSAVADAVLPPLTVTPVLDAEGFTAALSASVTAALGQPFTLTPDVQVSGVEQSLQAAIANATAQGVVITPALDSEGFSTALADSLAAASATGLSITPTVDGAPVTAALIAAIAEANGAIVTVTPAVDGPALAASLGDAIAQVEGAQLTVAPSVNMTGVADALASVAAPQIVFTPTLDGAAAGAVVSSAAGAVGAQTIEFKPSMDPTAFNDALNQSINAALEIAGQTPIQQEFQIAPTVDAEMFGLTLSAGITGAIAQNDIGGQIATTVAAQLQADSALKTLQAAGESAGMGWGGAFLSYVGNNLPAALLDVLVAKLGPLLYAQQQTNNSLSGATP